MKLLAPIFALALAVLPHAVGADPDATDWPSVLEEARGQTVYWNAWGGSGQTNAFIEWVGDQVAQDYGVTLSHVKLTDTSDAVTRVLAERAAGVDAEGAIDLIWINGANFAAMKSEELLFGPFARDLPNRDLVADDPSIEVDFGEPVAGLASPWAKAQLVFVYDPVDAEALPDMPALLEWSRAHPGRFTFPQPPDFLGVTFLKQALVSLADDPAALSQPVSEADFAAVTAPLWAYLDELTPLLWRAGRTYPVNGPAQLQLIADDEIDIAPSLSPGEASAAIAAGLLPDMVRTFVPADGTIGNASFVAIPYNATAKAGAMVIADFLLSPAAQLRAQDPVILGYGTVLDMTDLGAADAQAFADLDQGVATLSPADLGTVLPEPHGSWVPAIEAEWLRRYGITR